MKTTSVRRIGRRWLAITAFGLAAAPSHADLATQTGGASTLTNLLTSALSNVRVGRNQNDKNLWWFAEKQKVSAKDLLVDITTGGVYTSNGSLTKGRISGLFNSYLLYSDPVHSPTIFTADVRFSEKIAGILVLSKSLDTTDAKLCRPGTVYPFGDSVRGLELGLSEDFIAWNPNTNTVSIHNRTHGNVDDIRILTFAPSVPEPAFYQMSVLLGLAGLGLHRLRRKRSGLA